MFLMSLVFLTLMPTTPALAVDQSANLPFGFDYLTYEELVSLSEDKQINYILGMRFIISQIQHKNRLMLLTVPLFSPLTVTALQAASMLDNTSQSCS